MKEGPISVSVKPFAVKVFTTSKRYDYRAPWRAPAFRTWTGSGFVIQDLRIITNAHVVAGAIYVEVQVANDVKKYKATVFHVNHNCDLAVLKVEHPTFWKKVRAVPIGSTPAPMEKIEVHGFPVGGEGFCVINGTISRSENSHYTHSQQKLLNTQVSAPINPGNSGGAVIKQGEVVGVVHQELCDAQNIAYIIPASILKHFLHQVDTGVTGFPNLNITIQKMENAWLRSHFGMSKKQSGIRVVRIPYLSPADVHLKENDILLEINGVKINNNGTVFSKEFGTIDWDVLISHCHIGDMVYFKLLRDGKIIREKVILNTELNDLNIINALEFNKPPTYILVGGVVLIQPITKNFLQDTQRNWPESSKKIAGQQLLIINIILKTDHSRGYEECSGEIVQSVNERIVHNIYDVVEAVEEWDGDCHEIETTSHKMIVIPNLSREETLELLSVYDIANDRSPDLISPAIPELWFDEIGSDRRALLFSEMGLKRPGTPIPDMQYNDWQRMHWRDKSELSSLELSQSSEEGEVSSIESLESIIELPQVTTNNQFLRSRSL